LVVLLFLLLGGHHVVIYAVSGFSGQIIPGTFLSQGNSVELFVDRTADIFRVGALVASPVIVALLLTQFVMGMISKAVPTVNIFIVSFPLTIGIGLALSVLALPTMVKFTSQELTGIENTLIAVSHSALSVEPGTRP
jgi:flagellar biosynthesis protein FliR